MPYALYIVYMPYNVCSAFGMAANQAQFAVQRYFRAGELFQITTIAAVAAVKMNPARLGCFTSGP